MDRLNAVFQKMQDQLGIMPSLTMDMFECGANISIKWQDEGGNRVRMSRFVYSEKLATQTVLEILFPLCADIQDLLSAISKAKSEVFYEELMSGMIPSVLRVEKK